MDFDLPIKSDKFQTKPSLKTIFYPLEKDIPSALAKRQISSQIDLDLGFKIKQIEEILQTKAKQIAPKLQFDQWGPVLHRGAQTWIGLDFQILQTTYHDLKILFEIYLSI